MGKFCSFLLLLISCFCHCQVNKNDTLRVENYPRDSVSAKQDAGVKVLADITSANGPSVKPKYSPTRAGLYSAVLPGLGQYYNRKYWKIPIVWGGVGTGVGIALWNQKQYNRYREAFVAELNGRPHEFSDIPGITKEALGRVQDRAKRQRDYAIAITALVYVLNIADAVVDAHLYDQRHDADLTFNPVIIQDRSGDGKAGLSLNFNF